MYSRSRRTFLIRYDIKFNEKNDILTCIVEFYDNVGTIGSMNNDKIFEDFFKAKAKEETMQS